MRQRQIRCCETRRTRPPGEVLSKVLTGSNHASVDLHLSTATSAGYVGGSSGGYGRRRTPYALRWRPRTGRVSSGKMLGAARAAAVACRASCRCSHARCAPRARVWRNDQLCRPVAQRPHPARCCCLPASLGACCARPGSQACGQYVSAHASALPSCNGCHLACWPQNGGVWEKAGVGVSVVYGTMPPEAYRAARGAAAVKSPNGNGVRGNSTPQGTGFAWVSCPHLR